MAGLNAYKDTGEILFDTNLISYGLVKSGYMSFLQGWTRRELRSMQLDPNDGSNWYPSVASDTTDFGDGLWGFTVYNAISPIVFITGSGCLNGTQLVGNAMTFFYSNASPSTKFYCFDLMADIFPGSTYLKTWDTSGRITFNSLQPPLNVVYAMQAPAPGNVDRFGRHETTYAGGSNRIRQQSIGPARPQVDSYVDIALWADEFAAYLPWSRSCGYNDFLSNPYQTFHQYGGQEGVYGRYGGITFMFGASAGTTQIRPGNQGYSLPISFSNLPTDRFPVALVISTTNLIFPYN